MSPDLMPERAGPIHDPQAEMWTLGAVLADEGALTRIIDTVEPMSFYRTANQRIYAAMLRLFQRGDLIDPVTLQAELRATGELESVGGLEYLANLMGVHDAENVARHAAIVRDCARLRGLTSAAAQIAHTAQNRGTKTVKEVIERAEQLVFAVGQEDLTGNLEHVRKLIMPAFEAMEERIKSGGGLVGVSSGFPDLDEMTGGFQAGQLIVVAARPGMGKTAIATAMALAAAIPQSVASTPVAIFSLEMTREELVTRMLAYEAMINLKSLIRGKVADGDFVRLSNAAGILHTAPIWIDDTPSITTAALRAKLRRMSAEGNQPGMVIVDYLQLMRGDGENRTQEVSGISRDLKEIAKEYRTPLIALSQLSRAPEARSDKRPMLSDLRESGSIEQDADLVVFPFRPEQYMTPAEAEEKGMVGKAELIVAKQRNGPTGTVDLYFRKECARFESMTRREDPTLYDRHQRTVTSHA